MKRRLSCLILLGGVILVTALYQAQKVWATAASGFVGTTLAKGTFGEINVFSQSLAPNTGGNEQRIAWLSLQKTRGASDLYVQSNVWQPGGNTGWHMHPGHSLIIVTDGAVTAYDGDDPECKPHLYTKGMGFVDHSNHVHIIRNEGDVVATATAVQLVMAGAVRRIDVPDPGNCHF